MWRVWQLHWGPLFASIADHSMLSTSLSDTQGKRQGRLHVLQMVGIVWRRRDSSKRGMTRARAGTSRTFGVLPPDWSRAAMKPSASRMWASISLLKEADMIYCDTRERITIQDVTSVSRKNLD